MKKLSLLLSTLASTATFAVGGSMLDGFQITPTSEATAAVLGVDTSGDYVSNITASNGISTDGASTGEDISHGLSVDQSFDFTMTGNFTLSPSGTQDVTITTDADSHLIVSGLTTPVSGDMLCLTAGNEINVCDDSNMIGNFTANNFSGTSSGTNTGDQTITLTGDVTGSGTGSFATTIQANSVALTTDTTGNYVGTVTAGTGISTTGASSGEGIAHSISVDQSFSPTWTGQHSYLEIGNSTAQTFILDHQGDPNTKESSTFYTLTGMAPGELSAPKFVLVDTADSTGGQVSYINVQKIPTGAAEVSIAFAGAGVYPMVAAFGDPPASPTQAWREAAGPTYTDITTAVGSAGTDSQLFLADNNYVYIGADAAFFEIQVDLAIAASHNIAGIFQYWNGSAWTTFVPNDGTNGFTRNGNINFNKDVLIAGGWVATSVNSVSKYYIRIQRTANTVTVVPTENLIYTSDGVQNQWDPDGRITVQQITTLGGSTNNFAGMVKLTEVVTSLPTCNAGAVGTVAMYYNGSTKTSLCVCMQVAASTYSWDPTKNGDCP